MTAYEEGQQAARDGKSIAENPYDPITQDFGYQDWIEGYESVKGSV